MDAYYPHLGQRCYRVPALHFNRQRLIDSKGLEQTELHAPVRQSEWFESVIVVIE